MRVLRSLDGFTSERCTTEPADADARRGVSVFLEVFLSFSGFDSLGSGFVEEVAGCGLKDSLIDRNATMLSQRTSGLS